MSDPHSLPDNGTLRTENGFLFDDWELPDGQNLTEDVTLFDGKIIARMPDLGSGNIAKNIAKPEFSIFWRQVSALTVSIFRGGSPADAVTRERFFRRLTTFGAVMLLCGTGIFFFDYARDQPTENTPDIAEILSGTTESVDPVAVSIFSSALQSEQNGTIPNVTSSPAIPVAPVESVAAVSTPSPWDRPTADSHSQQGTLSKQSENPFQPIDVVADAIPTVPTVPSGTVVMSPMPPITGASMPVSPHEMPVSPFEMQLVAQSNMPSAGNHVPPNLPVVPPGMIPTHGQQQNMRGTVPQQHMQSMPVTYGPAHSHAMSSNNLHGQVAQHSQYVVPPGYMVPNHHVAPVSMPIPSGVSTLPTQGGYGMPVQNVQPLGTPAQRPHSDFYNAPPSSRWM